MKSPRKNVLYFLQDLVVFGLAIENIDLSKIEIRHKVRYCK